MRSAWDGAQQCEGTLRSGKRDSQIGAAGWGQVDLRINVLKSVATGCDVLRVRAESVCLRDEPQGISDVIKQGVPFQARL